MEFPAKDSIVPAPMEPPTLPHSFPNLLALAQSANALPWQYFREGVEIHWLYQDGAQGSAAALIRFQPGARVPLHEHTGFEHIFVLAGSQSDDHGQLEAGGLMIHAPGTRHRIASAEGCLVLAIYEKPVAFLEEN